MEKFFTETLPVYIDKYPVLLFVVVLFLGAVLSKLLNKTSKPLIIMIDQAVVAAENSFNSGEGAKKLEFALEYLDKHKKMLPWYLQLFVGTITRKKAIDLIEASLNRISVAFGTGTKVDIKGNEEITEG